MQTEIWWIGKTNEAYLKEGIGIYEKRLRRYMKIKTVGFADIKNAKNLSATQLKDKEGEKLLDKIQRGDFLILLDEKGKAYSSVQLARFIERQLTQSHHRIIFLMGGAFGFSDAVYERANHQISLSNLTFSHQMVRLFFMEQLYRAMTILRNEPYHNV